MNFSIDRQTLDELNLLGKFRQGSVYHLFNRVKTRGGERLLDAMFQHPLTDRNAINERSGIFSYFQKAALVFPFDVQQLNLMQEFLDAGYGSTGIGVFSTTYFRKVLSALTRDERHRKNIQGIQAVIVTLNKCASFLEIMPGTGGLFGEKMNAIRRVLGGTQLEKLCQMDIYKDLPLRLMAQYNHLLKNKLANELEEVIQFIHELDVYIAVSEVAERAGFTYASAEDPALNFLEGEELRHPCLQGAIGNDLRMDQNSNVIFLTGANMAGKSTLMKSIGINLYLAHMGFPVAAGKFSFSVRDGMYSSINVADNIGLGYSHFYAEVVRVKQAAEAAASGKRLMLMFDELFKGTNVKDAYDGTLAVTEGFAEYQDCLFIVSTHIIEVGEALKGTDNIQFVFMPTIMDGLHPTYTYRLAQGITEDRQGMMIIRNEGILELIAATPVN
ncbi:MutS-related protein [Pseudoflavitalea rhizosphaerae]|uniref:MutS-related protein n=1 Tax=Pseudoflavitalea rhizosphaerae TaxID=1884793 RepID=UPI000F8F2E08|nr:DNA mismatch repair protein [Pseudoflavitalea rhizosphaerae]